MKKQVLIILFLSLCYNLTYSQYILKNEEDVNWYSNIAQEKLLVSSNASLLFAGESLYYKVYCLNSKINNFSKNSKIAYVELVGINGVLFKQKIRLNEGVGSGDFFIPASVHSGNYKLIAYTQWMKNGNENNFFQADITIINSYKENANAVGSNNNIESNYVTNTAIKEVKPLISLQTNSKLFKMREKVLLNINKLGNGFGNYSVLVRKINTKQVVPKSFSGNVFKEYDNKTVSETKAIGESIYLPEFLGEMITGRVINKNTNKAASGKEVVLSILSDEAFQDIVKTNSHGVFYFQLRDSYSRPSALIQVLGKDRDNYSIEINEHQSINYDVLKFNEFHLSNEYEDMIKERSIHNQIQNAYFSVKQDTIKTDNYPKPFFGNPPTVYALDDYKRFPTIAETLVEVIDHVWDQKGEDGKRIIDVREREFDPYYGIDLLPMIIVDGAFIQDHQSLLDFDANKVKNISVLREEYYYGSIVYQGIVMFETFDGDYHNALQGDHLIKADLFSPQPAKAYFHQNYSKDLKTKNARIPDFREQLLWYPNLEFNKNKMTLEFFTSDIKGHYEIILEGFTNLGERVYVKENISVN